MSITAIAVYIAAMLAGAIMLNLGGWWATLRILDRLARKLSFARFIAVRHMRGRKSGFLTAIGMLSIFGVSFSSCTLTTVLSVMGGFSGDLKDKIFKTNSHILVDKYGADIENWKPILAKVMAVKGVKAATPIIHHDMMITAPSNNCAVKLMGIDLKSFQKVSGALDHLETGSISYLDNPQQLFEKIRKKRMLLYGSDSNEPAAKTGKSELSENKRDGAAAQPILESSPKQKVLSAVVVGREISRALRLFEGMEVNIVNPVGGIGPTGPIPKSRPFRVGGVFFSGMFEFDNFFAYTSLEAAQKFLNKPGLIKEIQIAINDPDDAKQVSLVMAKALGKDLRVRSWMELNAPLFSALKLEKIVMFIILSLATLVASFCIVATLTMLVLEKSAEVSVMMTLGASPTDIRAIFRFEGLLIGLVGTISGLTVAFGLCTFLRTIGLNIDPEVWYIDKLPVTMEWIEFMLVGLASLIITQLATLYPSHVAANLTPVEGLKNE